MFKTKSTKPVELPDGTYTGVHEDYKVTIKFPSGLTVVIDTNLPSLLKEVCVNVFVVNGNAVIEEISQEN